MIVLVHGREMLLEARCFRGIGHGLVARQLTVTFVGHDHQLPVFCLLFVILVAVQQTLPNGLVDLVQFPEFLLEVLLNEIRLFQRAITVVHASKRKRCSECNHLSKSTLKP